MSLLTDLIKYRETVIADRNRAANPPKYMNEEDYHAYAGREIALDEVISNLNKLIQDHS